MLLNYIDILRGDPIYINECRLNKRNTSLFIDIKWNINTFMKEGLIAGPCIYLI